MPHSLLDSLSKLFGTNNLYEVLGVSKDATDAQIRKAYHKVSLKVHPDRASTDEQEIATQKFQALGATYKILSDPAARGLYNESGEISDEDDIVYSDQDRDWCQYWRILFAKVTIDDIKNFEKSYRMSDEEKTDLKEAYISSEGDMNYILDTVLCSTYEDEARFTELIQEMIGKGEVPNFKKFSKESKKTKEKRKRQRQAEAEEAEQYAQELGLKGSSEDSLRNAIMQRQATREKSSDAFFDQLAAKYAKPSGKGKKNKK